MEKESQNAKSLESAVYETIRAYVARNDPEGLQYLQFFEDNLGTANESEGEQEFDQYFRVLFTREPGLQEQLKAAHAGNDQFINIVTGGHVEKIINIAKAGAVHIHEIHVHQEHYWINFRSFALLLSVLSAASLVLGGVYWKAQQPTKLKGIFNVAVATFDIYPSTQDHEIAENVSQTIYQFIDQEFNSPQYNIDIDVGHKNIGVISGEDRAEELAQSINADIIIYGTVRVINEHVIISPRFYIANSIKADAGELIGFHQLEVPQGLGIKDLPNILIEGTEERAKLLHNSEILIYFTQGLTYLVLSENEEIGRESYLRLAFESIQKAITRSNELKAKTGLDAGNEVLYLFASHISLLRGDQESAKEYIEETLSINRCYGRAYIAQGNVLYDMGVSAHADGNTVFQGYFDQAISSYNHALELDSNHADCEVQPYGYYLPVKAHTGLGNSYSFLFQVGPDAMNPALAQKALSNFEQVVTAQNYLPKDDPGRDLLTKLAANAQYQSGVIILLQEKKEQAIEKFRLTLQLEDCTPLGNKARDQLERLGETVTRSCGE